MVLLATGLLVLAVPTPACGRCLPAVHAVVFTAAFTTTFGLLLLPIACIAVVAPASGVALLVAGTLLIRTASTRDAARMRARGRPCLTWQPPRTRPLSCSSA